MNDFYALDVWGDEDDIPFNTNNHLKYRQNTEDVL